MCMVALTAGSPSLDGEVLPRFDRSPYMLLVEPQTMAWKSVRNPGWDTQSEVRLEQALSDLTVSDVVCGECEQATRDTLREVGIVMHRCQCGTTVRQAVERLKAGELPEDFWR